MSRTRHGASLWVAQVPRARRPGYQRCRRDQAVEVAIIGGGITGCAMAYVFAAAGVPVVLVEAGVVGQAGSAAGAGLLRQEPNTEYQRLEARYGRRVARRAWQMTRRAMLDGASVLRRLGVRCQLETQDAIYFTRESERVPTLRRELAARRAAGLAATWLTPSQLRQLAAVDAGGGIRTRGNGQLDPYRACLGLAAAAAKRGAVVCERSAVTRIRVERAGLALTTAAGGTLRAERVIVATRGATPLFKPLVRHLRSTHTYAVATPPLGARMRAELGRRAAMMCDTDEPHHYLRWTRDHRIVFGGADQSPPPPRRREVVLIQRTGQLMYELSTLYPSISGVQSDYAWAGEVVSTPDGLPFIGPHRHYPRHLFAIGAGGNGLAMSFLAARVLLRSHRGAPAAGDELFGFGR